MNTIIETPCGEFGTGLLVPAVRESGITTFAAADLVLDMADARRIVDDVDRLRARQLFGTSWIKSQGRKGSCNGYAGAKGLERQRVRRGLPHVELSGEGLYAQINGGRDMGSGLADGMRCLLENGTPPEAMVPREEHIKGRIPAAAWAEAAKYKATECYAVDTEAELVSGLALGFDAVVAVTAGGAFSSLDSEGVAGGGGGMGNHSVGVDDVVWSARLGCWLFDMFNSWGTQYGDDGRAYLTWKRHLASTVRYHQFFLIRSTTDGDAPRPPAAR